MVLDVEEREPLDGFWQNDQKGVKEFEYFGEVEEVSVEEEGARRRNGGGETEV